LVNADRVKRKLPNLLVDGSTTEKKSWNSLMRYRYRFIQFKRQQPKKFDSITNRILLDLTDLEKAVNESNGSGQHHKAS
jgi:very-short-patch-repair endonuclease